MASSSLAHADAHMADGDQHPHPTKADEHTGPRLQEGKPGSHVGEDAKDSRSVSNKADAEKKADKQEEQADKEKNMKPTDIARSHGNEPSRGAKIDEQIEAEERAELERKGKA